MEFKGRARVKPELNIAPLIDVVFLLLIFFMLTSTFTKEKSINVNLPKSNAASSEIDKSISITIDENENIFLNKEEIALDNLANKLKNLLLIEPKSKVLLRPDGKVEVQNLVSIMDIIKESGGKNISLATNKN